MTKLDLHIDGPVVPMGAILGSTTAVAREGHLSENSTGIWVALGQSLVDRGHLDQSLLCFKAALACDPANAAALAARGMALFRLGRHDEAMEAYIGALGLDPVNADTWTNLGVLYQTADCLDEAVSCFETALLHRRCAPEGWANLGRAQFATGDLKGALTSFAVALAYKPGDARLHFDRAIVLLADGDWQEGWRAYDARLKLNVEPRLLTRRFALWQGEPLAGKRVLALGEQGLGDVFQFMRFVSHLVARGAEVTLHVQSHLKPVLGGLAIDCEVIDTIAAERHFDFEVPLMSLPGRLGDAATILASCAPYLAADPDRQRRWAGWLAERTGTRRRIGIAWQGNPDYAGDGRRSLPLTTYAPLGARDDIALVSLQKQVGLEQIATAGVLLIDPGEAVDRTGAFVDTAAIIAGLDLIITSDTAVAHLAGAMGKPVWLLLASVPDWRWGRTAATTPWYPSMRIFRQTQSGDWQGVMVEVMAALEAFDPGVCECPLS